MPLAGLRVVDLTTFWAGPFATCLLADMGADVIKVESVQRPDGMRFAGALPSEPLWERSPVFAGVNPGKRDVTLRLDSPEGVALIKRLIEVSDVVIENFSPRVVEQFGLDWPSVHAVNPRAIMVRMPAFGLSGPWRDRPGFAMTVEQVSGLAWVTGYQDMPLVVRGACDPLGGLHAVFGLLLALEHRRRTGEGQLVEVALAEVALNAAAEQIVEYSAYGRLIDQRENRGAFAAPQGVYRAAGEDRWIAVAVATNEQWRALCHVIGAADLEAEPSLATAAGRMAAHDRIDERIEAWTCSLDAGEAARRLLDAGVPAQPLVNGHQLMPNAQLEARGFFQLIEHPVTGTSRYPGLPMSFSGLPRALHKGPPPLLGQHNDEVLRDLLGLDDGQITALRERKVIGERPTFM
ncbi:MAG: CoA transferase [Deltaproteobacteria bacterium]|nr:MAG: CoA transferase [Deltaproteobacteria bacterium]